MISTLASSVQHVVRSQTDLREELYLFNESLNHKQNWLRVELYFRNRLKWRSEIKDLAFI